MKIIALFVAVGLIASSMGAFNPHWSKVDDVVPSDEHHFHFKIAFEKQNVATMERLHAQMTDYYSPMFGKHLNNEQIKNLVSLPEEDIAEVEAYLMKDSGKFCEVIVRRSVHQDYLLVDTCATQAQLILPNLDLAVYRKVHTGHLILRHSIMMDPSQNLYLLGLPHQFHKNVAAIFDVTDLPVHQSRIADESFNPQSLNQPGVLEQTVQTMIKYFGVNYDGITDADYNADSPNVRQGVIEYDYAQFGTATLARFQKTYHVPLNPIKKYIGGSAEETVEELGQNIECSLDVQTITAISGKAQTWDFVFSPSASSIDVVEKIMSTDGAPKVYSCSYGGTDEGYDQSTANAINNDFLKLGLSGVTYMIASGDSGPTLGENCKAYNPQFPGGSAYVVSVGGSVQFPTTEKCWEHSSGGFSGLISRPSYQDAAVKHYLDTAKFPPNSNGSVYNTTGRAYPDVAAFGAFEKTFIGSGSITLGGTSGSSPQFAAMVTLVNIHRHKAGKGPVGGLTPTLYQLPKGIGFDITEGQTFATNRSGVCGEQYLPGFYAAEGFDTTTGLGSPKFDVMLEQLLNVPGESK